MNTQRLCDLPRDELNMFLSRRHDEWLARMEAREAGYAPRLTIGQRVRRAIGRG